MQRIAIVSDTYYPEINGVVTTLEKLAIGLTERDYKVDMIVPRDFFTIGCPTYKEMRLAIFPGDQMKKRLCKADIIHICTEGPLGFSARKLCKKNGWRWTSSFHTRLPEYINARLKLLSVDALYEVVRKFHKPSKAVLAPTPRIAEDLKTRGFKNVKLWGRGVDTDLFRPFPYSELTYQRPIHLYVGRISIEKNLPAFLDLDLPGTKLLVGDGPMLNALKKRYRQACFVGLKQGEVLANYYANADVFVFPSLSDTFGLVQIEALAAGTPVAAFNGTCSENIINDSVGCTDKNLKKAIKVALTKNRDDCRAHALQYSWDAVVDRFVKFMSKK